MRFKQKVENMKKKLRKQGRSLEDISLLSGYDDQFDDSYDVPNTSGAIREAENYDDAFSLPLSEDYQSPETYQDEQSDNDDFPFGSEPSTPLLMEDLEFLF